MYKSPPCPPFPVAVFFAKSLRPVPEEGAKEKENGALGAHRTKRTNLRNEDGKYAEDYGSGEQ